MKILLIKDSRVLRVAIERLVVGAERELIDLADHREALSVAHGSLPTLVLLDTMLPGLSGPCVLKELKQEASTSHIPIIVQTGLPQKNEAKLRNADVAAYTEKPSLDLEENSGALVQAIARVLGITGAVQSGIGDNASRAEAGVDQSEHRVGCSMRGA